MIKNIAAYVLSAVILGSALVSCNSDDNDPTTDSDIDNNYTAETLYSSTAVTTFNLKANNKILANLDSVFFTIDLVGAKIFNADSLPYGTKINKLLANIAATNSSKIELKVQDSSVQRDSTYTYTTSMTDSIDFGAKVSIIVTSLNEQYSRTYDVKVNVHQVKPDSLYWNRMAMRDLPADGVPSEQKTVDTGDRVLCFTRSGDAYTIASAVDPSDQWTLTGVDFGFDPQLASLTATSDGLYILDRSGALYRSADGEEWTSCSSDGWYSLLGGYDKKLVGVKAIDNKYYHAEYPASSVVLEPVAADFPVSGTSQFVTFDSRWNASTTVMMIGGRISNGNLSNAMWGYDGSNWARLSNTSLPEGYDGMTLVPYFSFRTNTTNWKVTKYTTLFAFGGRRANGSLSSKVYVSYDMGVTWTLGDDLLQLPGYVPAMCGSQAIVKSSMMHSRSAVSAWEELAPRSLPSWWEVASQPDMSRAVAPITEWECPYIYLFGGVDADGQLYDTVWRGVINRLTFKPLQ